jgi:hypothetical protein
VRCEVAHPSGGEINAVEVPVLVAVGVLEVEEDLVVLGPGVLADAALLVGGDDPVVVPADRLDPDLQDVLPVRRDPGEAPAVGRELGRDLLRVAEKDLSRNQRGEFRPAGRDGASERQGENRGPCQRGEQTTRRARHESASKAGAQA